MWCHGVYGLDVEIDYEINIKINSIFKCYSAICISGYSISSTRVVFFVLV